MPPEPRSVEPKMDRLSALLCHACAVVSAARVEEVYAHALEGLAEVLGAERGAIAVADAEGQLRVRASGGLSPLSVLAIEAHPSHHDRNGAGLLEALAPDGVAALRVMPLRADDGPGGLMVACYDRPHDPTDDEEQMGEILAAQVGAALGRTHGGGAYRLNHAQLRAVLDATGEGIVVRGADRTLLWANSEAARVLGRASVEDLLATPIDQVSVPFEVFDVEGNHVTADRFPGRRALATGGPVETIYRYRERATGSEHWVLLRAQELHDPDGSVLGSVTVFRDISVRQQALMALEQSEERLAFLASLGPTLLAASLDYTGVLERVADLLVPDFADYCAIREVGDDETLRRVVIRHADPAKAELVSRLESYPLGPPGSLTPDLMAGRALVVEEITDEQLRRTSVDEEHYRLRRQLNPRSALAVPVQARGRTIGIILLVSAESGRRYAPADAVLVEDLARRAGLAIDNARLFEEERHAREEAERTRSEMALLLDVSQVLASSLDYEEGLARLARLAASSLCDLCLIDLLDPDDGSIRRVAAEAADPMRQPLADMLRLAYPPDPAGSHPAVRVMRTKEPEYAPEMPPGFMEATTRSEEHRWITEALGFRSYVSVPLAARGRVLGALTLIATIDSGRRYGPGDVALVADLARRAALALDNARLYQQTQLQTALLASQSEAAIEGVLVVSADGDILSYNQKFIEMWGVPAAIMEGRDADALLDFVLTRVEDPDGFADRVTELRENRSERGRDEVRQVGGKVFDRWTAPLAGEDGVYRGRAWYFRDVTDLKRAEEERGRLYEAELGARLEADRARKNLALLLDASTLLTGAPHVEGALAALASLVVDVVADYCAIDLVSPEGRIERVAFAAADGLEGEGFTGQEVASGVIRSRRPVLVGDIREAPESLRNAFVGTSIGSYLGMPLVSRARVLGCLSLAVDSVGVRRYDLDDLALVQDLAQRVALALDHVRLFDAQRHIAMTLQASLLPPGLPGIPGVEIAARYRAAGTTSEVGGDFYDVFPVNDGAWALAMGDISGKGVEAASLTALARYTVRAAAREHREPREILLQLNEAVMDERPSSRFLTIALGRLRWRQNGLRLTVACGGHPPPLLLRADGSLERAGRPGTLIGFLPRPDLPEKVNELNVGDVALFFTDGLTDVRGPAGTFGEERLIGLLQECRGMGAEAIATRLETEVLAFQAGEPRDDLAMLVLRVVGPIPERPDAAQPTSGPKSMMGSRPRTGKNPPR